MMRRYTLEIGGREYVVDVNELAIDSFEVMVGSDAYVVTLAGEEDLPEAAIAPQLEGAAMPPGAAATAPALRVARKTAASAPSTTAQRKPAGGGGASLNAPMPGVIIEIAVKAGDAVARGQLVAVLDAMKMHNNIKSPRAGTIAEVCVDPGQAVGHGDTIVRYRED
jgi:glutaconyl-CoA/methylmalonyl-CoA decarboxylase subunit gamma